MARHQYGIFTEGTRAHHHLEWRLTQGVDPADVVEALRAVRAANADHRTTGGSNLVIGLGPEALDRFGDALLAELPAFPGYDNPTVGVHAPSTQRDVWVWVHAATPDVVIDVVRAAVAAMRPVATLELDQPGFTYRDSRDLTGFVDGTANPFLDEAPVVATVPAGSPGEGGSYAMTMRFVHDLDAFAALDTAAQEAVIGRTKASSVQLADDVKPEDAHISRAEVADERGEELAVYRRSVPWALGAEQGLHFVSFGADWERFDLQLRRIYGLSTDEVTDHLLSFTTAVTGSFWYCPTVEELDAIAPLASGEDD